jgi:carbon monoxide dehydrogenase subunit G
MHTLLIVVTVLAVAVIAFLIFVAMRSGAFRVERSVDVKAPPSKVMAFVDDFHAWASWSPFEGLDPEMKRTYEGAARGKGAIYTWSGNARAGSGRMEILDETPSRITIKLDFMAPFEAHNTAEFSFAPQGDNTHVTWAMYGVAPFMGKIFHLFVDMDRMLGGEFEKGLAALKANAER